MKRKSPRGIPDFSSKKPVGGMSQFNKGVQPAKTPGRPPEPPKVKPPATSMKSGRRGA